MAKVGVLLSNLGTSKSFSPGDVGQYLSEFLMDPYVIQIPKWAGTLFVKGIIVPFRRKKTAFRYKKIWSAEGSPLIVHTKKLSLALQKELGQNYKVTFAMRYGEPGFLKAKNELRDCQKVIFFPQYPQYAQSTVETSLHHFYKYFSKEKSLVIPPYYQNPEFTGACVRFLKPYLKILDFDYLLMSFHSLPVSHIKKMDPTGQHCLTRNSHKHEFLTAGAEHSAVIERTSRKSTGVLTDSRDSAVKGVISSSDFLSPCCLEVPKDILKTCYKAQCFHSARAIAQASGLSEKDYGVNFQSRLGPSRWIGPSTEQAYSHLIGKGVKKLAVFCPGFSVDGLETLGEVAMEGKKLFLQRGGGAFHFIPCLNDSPPWVQACAKMIKA